MKKRTKRMETALKIIQTWASTDKCNQQTRDDAMRDIEKLAIKALRKKEEKNG